MTTSQTSTCIPSSWWRNPKGYASRSRREGKKVRKVYAHRQAWEDAHGPIPEGLSIHHRCGVKHCINVEHLELMTLKDNGRLGRPCEDTSCSCTCHLL